MSQSGLHIIFDSASHGNLPRQAEVDVVAVHGLNFANKSDHARSTWTMGDKLWLKDFLPQRLPYPARVMLFEYNASPAIGAAAAKLNDHARALLQGLNLKRMNAPMRPLVFICHSLGGLVVKAGLVEATLDESYRSIIDATKLLIFFATPHRGGNYASVGNVAAGIVRTILGNPNSDLINALQQNSNVATGQFEQFQHKYEKYYFISFFETLPYGRLGIIVNRDSATLGLAGTRERRVSIEADHSSICRFSSADSPACELVLGTITMELELALTPSVVRIHVNTPVYPFGEQGYDDTVRKAFEVCVYLCDTHNTEEALTVYQWLLDRQLHHKGPEHPDPAFTRFLMGTNVYVPTSRWSEAATQFSLALEAQKKTLGEKDRDTLRTQGALGKSYHKIERLSDALQLLEMTLATQKDTLPAGHADIIDTTINLAAAYGEQGGHSERCRALLEDEVLALEGNFPLNRSLLIPARVNLGIIYYDDGHLEEARKQYLRALELETANSTLAQRIQSLISQVSWRESINTADWDGNLVNRRNRVSLIGERDVQEETNQEST